MKYTTAWALNSTTIRQIATKQKFDGVEPRRSIERFSDRVKSVLFVSNFCHLVKVSMFIVEFF